MRTKPKRGPGRPPGTGEIEARLSVGLPAHLYDHVTSRAREEKKSRARVVREAVEVAHQRALGLPPNQILVTIAPRDLEDLNRAIRNGILPDLEHATFEAIRRYLDLLPEIIKKREETLGNV